MTNEGVVVDHLCNATSNQAASGTTARDPAKDIIFCLVGTQVQVGDVFDESFSDDKEMSVSKGPFRSGLRFTFLFIERASW